MKVSVIVAAYNIENYIERCLMSIVNQTLNDIEIIVVNDGSIDKTKSIIEDIASKDSRIIVINQENNGLIEARKSGLIKATGEYILFIDGDDWIEVEAIELLYNKANFEDLDIVMYNAFNSYDDRKEELNTFNLIYNEDINNTCINPLKYLFKGNISPCIWSKLLKREFIEKNNIIFPSEISFGEDLATVATLFMYKPKVGIVDKHLYNYYQRETSITKNKSNKVLELDKVISFIEENLDKASLYEEYKEYFDYMIFNHVFFKWFLIEYSDCDEVGKDLLQLYLNRQIDINKNKYIRNKFKNLPLSLRIRIKCYNNSYKCGKLYDNLRYLVKGS